MGLNPELVKLAFGWVQATQTGNTLQQSDGFRNVGTVQMQPQPKLNPSVKPGAGVAANPAAKATGQTVAGGGESGTLSGTQPKAASLNRTLVKMAVGRVLRETY